MPATVLGHEVIFGDDEFSGNGGTSRNEMVGKAATKDSFLVDQGCTPVELGFYIENFANRIYGDVGWTDFAIGKFSRPQISG